MDGLTFRSRWVLAVLVLAVLYLSLLILLIVLSQTLSLGRIATALFIGTGAAVLIYVAALVVNLSDVEGKLSATWRGGSGQVGQVPDRAKATRDDEDDERLQLLAEHDRLGVPGKELRDRYRILLELARAAEGQQRRLALADPAHAEGFTLAIDDLLFRVLGALGAAACVGYALGSSNLYCGLVATLPAISGEVVTRMNDPDRLIRAAMKRVQGREPEAP